MERIKTMETKMTKAQKRRLIVERIYWILQGVELIFDGFLGPCEEMKNIKLSPDSKKILWHQVIHVWHPSYWIGWFRCVVLKDAYGSGLYKKRVATK